MARSHGPLLLLFIGRPPRGRYAPISAARGGGLISLAIDQRSGGSLLGGRNQTVAARGSQDASYDEAYADLEAALAWARAQHSDRSSSYLGQQLFRSAGVPAGSSTSRQGGGRPGVLARRVSRPRRLRRVGHAAAQLRMPVFVTSAPDQGEEEAAAAIVAVVPAKLENSANRTAAFMVSDLARRQQSCRCAGDLDAVLSFLAEAAPPR